MSALDMIPPSSVANLSQLFVERVRRSPDKVAYQYYSNEDDAWRELSWKQVAALVARCQSSLRQEHLVPGDRIAIMLKNSHEWVVCDQAALGLGMVIVPLYINDRPDNIAYIINHASVKILFVDSQAHLTALLERIDDMPSLQKIICLGDVNTDGHSKLVAYHDWLSHEGDTPAHLELDRHSLATIVYTSGTTGKSKGVMLSHGNILWNADACGHCENFTVNDIYLSFLPLSHMFERTVGYYLPVMSGGVVAFARSIEQLADDLQDRKPTILVTVPRIFERVYNKLNTQLKDKSPLAQKLFGASVSIGWLRFQVIQGRAGWHPKLLLWPVLNLLVARKINNKLGGRLRLAISGGAPLSYKIAKTFLGLGVTLTQGYGMTEASPVITTNRIMDNEPASVGKALPDVELRLGEDDELLVRSPGLMLGYWKNDTATHETIDSDGWLHTGDKANIKDGYVSITGRIKDILVLSNGEKMPPADLELAITADPLFEQAMVIGEGKPFLSLLTVLNRDHWQSFAKQLNASPDQDPNSEEMIDHLLERVRDCLQTFPGYAKVYRLHASFEPWSVEDDLITPTLKLKRNRIVEKYQNEVDSLYAGH